ncbi:hypothetical protein L6164_027059 [Bauhinia variegata]|uniref:Uncharacterized protein n=1 Tax=Bauhinia variegata TaxID=167791 RepID=A0ACB9LSX2_BAUVA|nr:hypothetical protein L6164_027059 [Bauhinia variegata]
MAKRRREREAEEENNNESDENIDLEKLKQEAAAVTAALVGARRARKRFIGVRQRPSGRWVAEIKDTIHKIRLWLGTYDTAEEAARAYDEAACLLRGSNTRTNFWPSPNSHSNPALPSKIANLLLLRLKARTNAYASAVTPPFPASPFEQKAQLDLPQFGNSLGVPETGIVAESYGLSSYTDDFLQIPETGVTVTEGYDDASYSSGAITSCDISYGSAEVNFNQGDYAEKFDLRYDGAGSVDDGNNGIMNEKGAFGDCEMGFFDFQFVDTGGSICYSSPFEVAEEMVGPIEEESYGDEPPFLRETMKMMKYERKVSACLYTFNGVSECLRLKRRSESANGYGLF